MASVSEKYNLIVVGAGPAGSTAAKFAAEARQKVLLIEKEELPREKSCSGFLIQKSVNFIEKYYDEMPDTVFCEPKNTGGFILTNEVGKEFRFESPGLNIWRKDFDYWLTTKAQEAGAELRTKTAVNHLEENEDEKCVFVHLNDGGIEKADAVIVCEGAAGTLKNKLMKQKSNLITTYQTYCIGKIDLDAQFFYAYLQEKFSEYDAWINFKDEFIIIGVAVENPKNIQNYHVEFISYLEEEYNLKIHETVKEEKWVMPHIQPECCITAALGRILFAGETAGFLNPMGEGISSAFLTGKAAAEAIINAGNCEMYNPEKMKEMYEKEIEPEKQYLKRQWKLTGGISTRFQKFIKNRENEIAKTIK